MLELSCGPPENSPNWDVRRIAGPKVSMGYFANDAAKPFDRRREGVRVRAAPLTPPRTDASDDPPPLRDRSDRGGRSRRDPRRPVSTYWQCDPTSRPCPGCHLIDRGRYRLRCTLGLSEE